MSPTDAAHTDRKGQAAGLGQLVRIYRFPSLAYTCDRTHQNTYLRSVHFTIYD